MGKTRVMSAHEFLGEHESRATAATNAANGSGRFKIHGAARTGRTRLELPSRIPIEMWKHIGLQISTIGDATAWWLGDWLIYGEDKYPDRYLRAISETVFNYQTLRNYAWVARRFPPSRRRDTLSFQHHAEVAALESGEQDRWLDEAVKHGWSRNRLRHHLQAERRGNTPRIETVLRVRASEEQRGRWETAAERSHRPLAEWVVEALDSAATILYFIRTAATCAFIRTLPATCALGISILLRSVG
jgi:hypothetical protein